MNSIRVMLAEDHQIVRQGLRLLIEAQSDMTVVGEAAHGREALMLIQKQNPDVLVFDITMPEMNGIELAKILVEQHPNLHLLALTANEDRAYLNELLRIGVKGYLLKRSASIELIEAIRALSTGRTFVDRNVVDDLVHGMLSQNQKKGTSIAGSLTDREEEVIRLISRGHTNKEVALQLDISIKTVETHKARAMTKLQLQTRAELIRYAAARRWITND